MEITFPGGVAVSASFNGYTVNTDQSKAAGGDGSAPSPFDLFLASLGTCAGFFALRFCQQRQIDTAGLSLSLNAERDPQRHRLSKVSMTLHLPEGFPEKYHTAILKATDRCAVKRAIEDPPEFSVQVD
ncbi:MAG: osmotically inducible protein OsmC [Desulfuromonas sp.]|nr:MAG: osmotically inducible protein OsmC [Desulfuromonas sp.]